MLRKQVISEKTLLIWIVSSAAFSVAIMIPGALIILGIYGCWPIGAYVGADDCLAQVGPSFLRFLPPILGFVAGTILTLRMRKTD